VSLDIRELRSVNRNSAARRSSSSDDSAVGRALEQVMAARIDIRRSHIGIEPQVRLVIEPFLERRSLTIGLLGFEKDRATV